MAMDLVRLSQFVQRCGDLLAITVEDWILIQRSSFDLHIDDLPYHAIQVYVKVTSRSRRSRQKQKGSRISNITETSTY